MAMKRVKFYHDKLLFSASSNSDSKCCRLNSYVEKVFSTSKVTQDISEILASLEDNDDPQFMLIEGDSGIGKSFLLREIAYQWSKGKLLQSFKLVLLLCLRDPFIKQLSTIEPLLLSLCKGDSKAKEIVSTCNNYLIQSDSKDLVLLIDSYDIFPQHLEKDSLIGNILNRKILANYTIIVSSCPHASASLHSLADIRVDIWGFAEEDSTKYVKQALGGQPQPYWSYAKYLTI